MKDKNFSAVEILKEEKNKIGTYLKVINSLKKKIKKGDMKSLKSSREDISKAEVILSNLNTSDKIKLPLKEDLDNYRKKIEDSLTAISKRFAVELEKKLKGYNMQIRGNLPLLRIGIYEIEVNKNELTVTIYYGQKYEKITKLDMDAEAVADKIIKTNNELFDPKQFKEETFLKDLLNGYKRYISVHNIKFGDEVPIRDFLGEFVITRQERKFFINPTKKNYKEYSRLQFSADLSKLRKKEIGENKLILITATRAYTKKSSDFIWIPIGTRGDGNWYSHIKFKKIS